LHFAGKLRPPLLTARKLLRLFNYFQIVNAASGTGTRIAILAAVQQLSSEV
jgi:capsular polysaccharide biosynthesis protein